MLELLSHLSDVKGANESFKVPSWLLCLKDALYI